MPKTLMFLVIGLFFGTGFGFLLAASSGAKLEGHDHAGSAVHDHNAHDHGDGDMDHAAHSQLTEVAAPAPELTLTLHPDGERSRNLHINATNFTFSPISVNGPHVPGEGHAHVYVNDIKVARSYSPWMQIAALPVGTHTIRVTLNANDHTQLAVEGEPIEATMQVTVE